MAITYKLDINIQKKVLNENTGYMETQFFLAPFEKKAIIHKLHLYTEELAQLNRDGVPTYDRIEIPVGLDDLGRSRGYSIWYNYDQDLKRFSRVYKEYQFYVTQYIDGKIYYSCFKEGNEESVKQSQVFPSFGKRKFYYVSLAPEQIDQYNLADVLNHEQIRVLTIDEGEQFQKFCLTLWDEEQDYMACELVYETGCIGFQPRRQSLIYKDHKNKRLKSICFEHYTVQYLSILLQALKYSYSQNKYEQHLTAYPQRMDEYYQQLMEFLENAIALKHEILFCPADKKSDLAQFVAQPE